MKIYKISFALGIAAFIFSLIIFNQISIDAISCSIHYHYSLLIILLFLIIAIVGIVLGLKHLIMVRNIHNELTRKYSVIGVILCVFAIVFAYLNIVTAMQYTCGTPIPDQCAITSGFTCREQSISIIDVKDRQGSGFVRINVINNIGEEINLNPNDTNAAITRNANRISSSCAWNKSVLQDGEQATLTCEIPASAYEYLGADIGGKAKVGFELYYQKIYNPNYTYEITGTITATVQGE